MLAATPKKIAPAPARPAARPEPMDSVDVTWLRMDRPANPMTIFGVLILAGPVDVERLASTLVGRMLEFGRFRKRVETRAAGYWWCEDPNFEVAHHIKRTRLPGAADKPELQRFVADLAARPLDRSHPLWDFHIVEDYEGGAAVVARLHHAIADGIALVKVLLSLTDDSPIAPAAPEAPHAPDVPLPNGAGMGGDGRIGCEAMFGRVGRTVDAGLRVTEELRRVLFEIASHPARARDILRHGTGIAGELAYLLLMPSDTPTRLKGVPCGDKRVAWSDPIPLPEVKAVGHALGCSVNDMLLASVAGALKGYLEEKGDPTAGVEIRALVPINLRPPDSGEELGNRFGIIAVELPVGFGSPLERLYEVRRRMEALKASYEPSVTLGLFAGLGYAPQFVQDNLFDLLLSRATAVMTNVPGPQQAMYLAGSEVRQLMFWVPQSGNIGMGVSILSFNGKVHFGLFTDAALVPDPEAIIARFAPEFERLLYLVLMSPWDEGLAAAATPASEPRAARASTRAPGARRRAANGTGRP
jgi:diacylglycerol O-acyltransferase